MCVALETQLLLLLTCSYYEHYPASTTSYVGITNESVRVALAQLCNSRVFFCDEKKNQRRVDEGLEAAVDDANVTPELPCQSHVALQYIYVHTERERERAELYFRSCVCCNI